MFKGQSSIEFLTYVSLASLALAAMYAVMAEKQGKAFEFQNRKQAQQVAEDVGFEVEMALVQGDGYSRVFSLPENLAGNNYNVTVVNGTTFVEWGDSSASRRTLYDRRKLNISVNDTNVFRVSNREGEVVLHAE